MSRSDNYPVSGSVTAVMTDDRLFVPVGFKPKSVIVSHVSGKKVKFDGCSGNGFYVASCSSQDDEKKIEFQYMVS